MHTSFIAFLYNNLMIVCKGKLQVNRGLFLKKIDSIRIIHSKLDIGNVGLYLTFLDNFVLN